MKVGHRLLAHNPELHVGVALPGDRRLEPQDGGLWCRRTQRSRHRGRTGEHGLSQKSDQQGAPAAADSPRCQRQRNAYRNA